MSCWSKPVSEFSKNFYRVLFLLIVFSIVFVTIFAAHLKSQLEAGTLVVGGKVVGQEEPPSLLDPSLEGRAVVECVLRHVSDPADPIFADIPDSPPVLSLEVSVHGTLLAPHKVEGITRSLLRYFDRELRPRLAIIAVAYVDAEDGSQVFFQWRNGAWGLRAVNREVFYLH